MSYRHSARYGASLENEQRRLQREPVAIWKQQWVVPAGAPQQTSQAPIKILKWIKTADTVKFDEEGEGRDVGDETMTSVAHAGDVAHPAISGSASMDVSAAHTPAPAETLAVHSSEVASSGAVAADGATDDSQLFTQASLPVSDPMDRPSTQDDSSSSNAVGSTAPVASLSTAEPGDMQTQETAVSVDEPVSVQNVAQAAAVQNDDDATQAAQADREQEAMALRAEAEAQQGGTNDGSLPAQEFLPTMADP